VQDQQAATAPRRHQPDRQMGPDHPDTMAIRSNIADSAGE
jgi:hypothetical protein